VLLFLTLSLVWLSPQRAVSKAHDKYKGNYMQLTDLARMTFECHTLQEMVRTLQAMSEETESWELIPVTNRINPAYNAVSLTPPTSPKPD
jgi:hypothetical protein